jgi:hypothetical protein
MNDDIELPPLEHAWRWPPFEIDAIRDYARAAVLADREKRGADALRRLLLKCREEFDAMPRSLAYDLTIVREIDAALAGEGK